ncbi:MAG TPA: SPOR domain-containing protein [Verrucomicrobiae bacterium]|nr:SPOR domain-containing protein [Verrucomicrobiae bacterium]
MIRTRTAVRLGALLLLALGTIGCAGHSARPGEPTAREQPVDGPAAVAAATPESEKPFVATENEAPALPPPPPTPTLATTATSLVLSSKPRIIAKVETVQLPAWVERGGVKAAMKAGWALYTGDRVVTGPEGRLVLSTVGEGRIQVAGGSLIAMTPAYESTGGPEPALLTLQRGAISMTAPMVRSGTSGLPVQIGSGITADILGGNVFAKADADEDVLALVDGVVQVSGPKLNPGTMKKADTFLRVPRIGRPTPVSEAGGGRLARWLSGTELLRNKPQLDASGTWDVSLNSGYNVKILETMACQIQARGYPSEIYPVREPGKQVWYRVVVRRFKSKTDAIDFLGTAKALGSREPWVLIPQT